MNDPYKTPVATQTEVPHQTFSGYFLLTRRYWFYGALFLAINVLTIEVWLFVDKQFFPFIGSWRKILQSVGILAGGLLLVLIAVFGAIGFSNRWREPK